MTEPLTNPNELGAAAIIKAQLEAWGISELYADALKILKQGLNADAVVAQLQETQAFKQRFWYNETRRKAGLGVLSPAEAVATENQMRAILRQFGLPSGFYDSAEDVGKFIANNVSASELADRAQTARDRVLNAPPETLAFWRQHYGATTGDAVAALIDFDKALPLIRRRLDASAIGGAANRQGLDIGAGRAEQLASLGVSDEQAQAGFGQVAAALPGDAAIANRFGSTFTQTEEEDAALLKSGDALRKKQRLNAAEAGLFAGGAGTTNAGLSGSTGGR